jgi:hypothetical protein
MADPLIARLGEVAILTESTKGTKAVDANAVDGTYSKFRVYDLRYTPDVRIFERSTMAATLSRYSHLVAQTLGRLSFKLELRKTAATATEDAWGKLLAACGFSFTSGTGVYKPVSTLSTHKTLTMYAFNGSTGAATVRIGMRGCAGNVRFVFAVGQPAFMEFEFWGVSSPSDSDGSPSNTFALKPTDDVLNTLTHETSIPNICNGIAFTYASNSKRVTNLTVDVGNRVVPLESLGDECHISHYAITDRAVGGECDPDFGLVANDDDYVSDLNAGTEVALAWTVTQSATTTPSVLARTLAFAIPKAQLTAVNFGDRNGIVTAQCTYAANKSAEPGDDEFTMTVTGS